MTQIRQEPQRRPAPSAPPAAPRGVLAVSCMGMFLVFVQVTQTVATLREVQVALAIATADLVWVPSTYTLVVAAGVLTGGAAADRFGRRRVFLTGVGVLLLGSVVLLVAGSFVWVLVGQAVAGAGAALVLPASLALVSSAFADPHERARAIALWTAASGAGLAVGPLNAGVVVALTDWNAVFVLNVVIALAALAAGARVLRESAVPARRIDTAGAALAFPGIAALVFALITGGQHGYGTAPVLATLAVAIVLLTVLVVVELRVSEPMLDVRLMRNPAYSAALLVAAVVMFVFVGVTLLHVLWLSQVAGLSVLAAAAQLQLSFAGFIAGSITAGQIVRGGNFRGPLLGGLALAGVGAAMFALVDADSGLLNYAPAFIVFGLGCGLANAPATALAVASVPAGKDGAAAGTVNAGRQLGAVLGTSLLGTYFASQLPGLVRDGAADAGLPGPVSNAAAEAVKAGDQLDAELVGQAAPLIDAVVDIAFTSATSSAVLVAAAVTLVSAVIAAMLLSLHDTAASR